MAYVESFARAMERARASVSYWDRKTLDQSKPSRRLFPKDTSGRIIC